MENHDSIRILAQRLREHAAIHDQHVPHDDEQATWAQDLRAAADIISTARTEHPDEAVFRAAILDLASISEALGLDPDAGGAAPILDAIEQLRAAWPADSAALRNVVTAAQALDEASEELELDDGAGRAADLTHWHALDDALEDLHKTLFNERRAATASAPADPSLPYELALAELIDKIAPGLDTGDILTDARQASMALDGRDRVVQTLIAHAEGRVDHAGNGLCPDGLEGHDARDPDCVVCRALSRVAQPQQDEKEQAVIEAAMEWWAERTVRDWGDIRLAKAVATLGGDWPGCDECDHQCGEDCRPMTVAEMHAAIDHQTADLIHAGILFADDEWTRPAGWKPSDARTRELLRTKIRYVFAPGNPAARDVLAERQRQVSVEGWTPEHDDQHADGELARAGASYAAHAGANLNGQEPLFWPWERDWWKPGPARRMLVKAGALILAEIDRIDRAAARVAKGE